MRWSLMLGMLGACTGTDEDKPTNTGDDNGDDVGTTPTGETGTGGTGDFFEPVAVGFEFDGVITGDGTPGSFLFDDPNDGLTYERYPYILVTFASIEYFEDTSQTEEEIAARTCSVASTVPWTPSAVSGQIPTHDGALLHYSYEVALDLEIDPDSTDCDEELDPAVWGEDAQDLLEQFDGMHFGYGWGQQTTYLSDNFEQATLDDEEFMSAWLSSYVAINDIAGDWVGYDWTYGFAFQWDIETGYLVTVPDPEPPPTYPDRQLLVRQTVTDIPAGDPLPPLYIRSSAYWYQDFPYMDLSNLKDGAP